MKRVILAVAAALLIASCTSESGKRQQTLKKRVVKEMYLSTDSIPRTLPNKEIKLVDVMFEVGDTVKLASKYYLIIK